MGIGEIPDGREDLLGGFDLRKVTGAAAIALAVRAMISATITRSEVASARPGIRFGLIDCALAPLDDALAPTRPETVAQLKRDLAVIVSAEALFTLTDMCGQSPDEAIASVARTARTLAEAAARRPE